MTNFIPIFPLNIVVFPDEQLNLHIFEPRYKQLITDCYENKKQFGIPTVLKNSMSDFGTSVDILSIEKIHENGEMDIKTKGNRIFKIIEPINFIPDKLYHGAIVTYPENILDSIPMKWNSLLELIRYFHELLEVKKDYKKANDHMQTYDIAHHAGLSLEQEYEFLCLLKESQRQEFLHQHLKKTIPTIVELQNLKKRIEMNGHFRKLSINEENNEV